MQKLLAQIMKFGVVGVIATVIDFGIMNLLHYGLGLNILIANTSGFIISLIFNYLASMKYVFAHKEGMSRRRAVIRHAFGNALIPIITYLGNHMAGIIGGASIVETIFAIPGIGSYAIAGVQSKDYYVVQAYVLFSGCIYVLTNILIDLIYIALDPKIRAGEAVES
jgi:peptide/nickel transport system permease protein